MNKRRLRIALAVTAAIAFALSTNAKLDPTQEMASQTSWAVNTIKARHYLRGTMEQLNGAEMVEVYTESFDYGRMHFLRSDIDDFIFRFADAMDGFLQKGNLYAAFEIYNSFKEKAEARTEWAFERLEQDFDFTVDETFTPDRREAEWPADQETADALWLRRLKYELLNEMLSLASVDQDQGSDGASLTPQNPDIVDPGDKADEFDPTKLLRLLQDEAFAADILDQAREKIRRRYERNLSYTVARESAEVQESFINSMTQLFDPHSIFLSSNSLEDFNSSLQNSLVGIGAALEVHDGICTINEILPGGPAERSRLLEAEDQILGVAQGDDEFEDVIDMPIDYIVRKIKGEKGTTVRLLIRPGDAADPSVRKIVPIVRSEVKLTANLATGKLINVPSETGETVAVGVIELPSFYGNIGAGNTLATPTNDIAELLEKLSDAGAQGIVLDLRGNGGGLLGEAIGVTGLFIPVGPVVQVIDSMGRKEVLSDHDPSMMWDGPLIVLTSRSSASASEIVAGALQDHGRALIVGNSSTHGKGTVQEVYHMNDRTRFSFFKAAKPKARPVASKITTKQFYLPDGSSTQVRGVPSDIVLPSVNEFLQIGEDDLPHTLPWGEVDAVDWANNWPKLDCYSLEEPLVEQLSAASQARQASLEEFQFLTEQIEWYRERHEEKAISIDLAARIDHKIHEKSYIDKLDATYDALSENNYTIKEFLLKVTEEQDARSKKVLAEPMEGELVDASKPSPETNIEKKEEDEPRLDIYLREAARIMADWVQSLDDNSETAAV